MAPTTRSAAREDYSDDAIQNLTDREHVRTKMGMYIGSKGIEGLHQVILEIVSNGVDEHLAGFATDIWVTIHKDHTIVVRDNGRGIPIGTSTTAHGEEMPTPQMVSTVLKAGGKFAAAGTGGAGYNSSGGTHGIGLKAAAFLSTRFELDVWRDGQHYHQEMTDGAAVIARPIIKRAKGDRRGTQVGYRFDPSCFAADTHVDAERVLAKLREVSYPCPDLTLHFEDQRADIVETIRATRGIEELVIRLAGDDDPLWKNPIRLTRTIELPAGHERNWLRETPISVVLDVAILPTNSTAPGERSAAYTNVIPNPDGGRHVAGTKSGIAKAMKGYMSANALTKSADTIETVDILQGLAFVVAATLPEPSFAGQHKSKLDTQEMESIAYDAVKDWLADWLTTHEKDAKAWAKSVEEFRLARVEFKKVKQSLREQRKGRINALSSKLAAHQGAPAERAELFIVEGDSAGGTAKAGRDSRYQAIFPLRGKPMNVLGAKLSTIAANIELAAMMAAVGLELRGEFVEADIHYGKIVLLADADPDGGHISLLLLQFLMQEFPDLIRTGRVYLCRPPLFRVSHKRTGEAHLLANDETLTRFMKGKRGDDWETQRFKGLGEMNDEQLRYVAFDPATRGPFLYQVTFGDHSYASELMTGLMGKDTTFKRDWIRRYVAELAGEHGTAA